MKTTSYAILASLLLIGCSRGPKADYIIEGKIWTGNPEMPWAGAMAIAGDTIVAIGENALSLDILNTSITVLDDGQLVVPGFIDTHTHFVDGGFRLSSVQLR